VIAAETVQFDSHTSRNTPSPELWYEVNRGDATRDEIRWTTKRFEALGGTVQYLVVMLEDLRRAWSN
jgi:hypothetical protein